MLILFAILPHLSSSAVCADQVEGNDFCKLRAYPMKREMRGQAPRTVVFIFKRGIYSHRIILILAVEV